MEFYNYIMCYVNVFHYFIINRSVEKHEICINCEFGFIGKEEGCNLHIVIGSTASTNCCP